MHSLGKLLLAFKGSASFFTPRPNVPDTSRISWLLLLHSSPLWKTQQRPAAAAESPQLCPTLCDPIDDSPPGSAVPGILQARTLQWVAIAFSYISVFMTEWVCVDVLREYTCVFRRKTSELDSDSIPILLNKCFFGWKGLFFSFVNGDNFPFWFYSLSFFFFHWSMVDLQNC